MIQNHSVDQQLYLFKGKEIDPGLKLVSIQTKLNVTITENHKGDIYRTIEMEHLNVSFSTEKEIIQLQVNQEDR